MALFCDIWKMKKLIPLLLVLAILAGIGMANLGERRVYPLRPGLKYRFTPSRDPNHWWDDVNDIKTIHGELIVDDINCPGKFKAKDVNVTGDLTLPGLTASRLMYTDADSNVASVSDLTAWIAGTTNQITVTDDTDGTVTLSLPQDIHTGASPQFAQLRIDDISTYIDKDGSDNMTFTDAVVGTKTLKQLGSPTYTYIKAATQSEGDLHLSDGTNWGVSKAMISIIRVVTSSTDWDLYILQNDNGFAANDANIPRFKIMADGDGDANIRVTYPYEDEDASDEVHLYYIDNSGTNTADIYVIGYELV